MQSYSTSVTPIGPHEQPHVTRTSQGIESAELLLERLVERSRQHRSDRIKALLVRIGALALSPAVRFGLPIVKRLSGRNAIRM